MAKGDKIYYEILAASASCAREAANYLVTCLENYDPTRLQEMLETMHEIEHRADTKKHDMDAKLAKAFVTPIEREDLALLSYDLDEVTDKIEEVLQKFYMYDIHAVRPDAVIFARKAVQTCDLLCSIMEEFENFKKTKKLKPLIDQLNNIEEECDSLYLTAMRELMVTSTDVMEKLSWHETYGCLEACIDACEHVSECVDMVIMKNT